jgi:hypothetical protein
MDILEPVHASLTMPPIIHQSAPTLYPTIPVRHSSLDILLLIFPHYLQIASSSKVNTGPVELLPAPVTMQPRPIMHQPGGVFISWDQTSVSGRTRTCKVCKDAGRSNAQMSTCPGRNNRSKCTGGSASVQIT